MKDGIHSNGKSAYNTAIVYTPPTMSTRTAFASRARRLRAERRHALRVGAMGGVAGEVGFLYEMMGGLFLRSGAGAAR